MKRKVAQAVHSSNMERMKDTGRQVKRFLVLATSALLIVAAQLIPSHEPDTPLRVAVGLWPGSESFLEAQERGILPESRFVFLEATWPSAAYRAFDNNAVDVAVLSAEDVGRLRAVGENVRIICVMDESRGADALIASGGIESVAQLAGKKIGVSAHGPGLHFLDGVLATAGLSRSDVQIVTLLEPDIPDSLASGGVSAVVAAEPWLEGVLSGGGRILVDSAQVETPFYRMLVARDSSIAQQRDELVELLRAHFEVAPTLGGGAAGTESLTIPKRQRVSQESFADIMGRIHIFTLEENLELMRSGRILLSDVGPADTGEGWIDKSIVLEVEK